MPRNRVIYQSEALFVGPTGAEGNTAANNKQLTRVQSANYNFEIARQDVNQFGNLAAIDRIILEQPTVSLDFSYYVSNGANEENIGLTTDTGASNKSAISDILTGANSIKNYYILTTKEGTDANNLGVYTHANNSRTIGIGNANISSYQIEAAVGDIPTASVTVEGLNMNFINGNSGTSPTINATNGTSAGHNFSLPTPVSGDGFSALRPGDITVTVGTNNGATFGVDGTDWKVQSASMSFDLNREDINKLGSKFAFTKEITFPVTVTMNVEALVGDGKDNNLATLVNDDSTDYTISLNIAHPTNANKRAIKYTLKKAKLDSQEFSSSIGDNKSVSLTFSAQIGGPADTLAGLFIDKAEA